MQPAVHGGRISPVLELSEPSSLLELDVVAGFSVGSPVALSLERSVVVEVSLVVVVVPPSASLDVLAASLAVLAVLAVLDVLESEFDSFWVVGVTVPHAASATRQATHG